MLEGLMSQAVLIYGSTDLIVSRGVLMGYYAYCTLPARTFLQF